MAYDKNKKSGTPDRKDSFSKQTVQPKAPYNFVPFSDKVIVRYEDVKDLPDHDVINPNLKSGEIHITMRAETPVFVSDGTEKAHFFRGANGKQMIPGSSVRGMVRNNMFILGAGKITDGEDVADQQLFYRKIANAKKSVDYALKKYYAEFLDIKQVSVGGGKPKMVPRRVRAGFLKNHKGSYEIMPIEKYYRLSRMDRKYQEWADRYAFAEEVFYTLKDSKVDLVSKKKDSSHIWLEGTLLSTGKAAGKPNGIYLFPKAKSDEKTVAISERDVRLYKADYEKREKTLGKNKSFWQLPKPGEEKPVFFAETAGYTIWGMSLYPRIPYSKKLTDGLPDTHKTEGLVLDYPKAMLGFATRKESYRSRVSFGDFSVQEEVQEMPEQKIILGEPKPSFFAGYTVDGKHYEDEFALRGYKQYWLKEVNAPIPEKMNVASTINPLPTGTEFHGVIKYKNLYEDELGLLLWAIQLEEDCYQSVGMAKPYGFGRIKISVDSLKEFDFAQRYTVEGLLRNSAKQSDSEQIQKYIESYQNCEYVKNAFGGEAGILDQEAIKDFFCIHKKICQAEDVRYMTLPEYSKNTEALPSLEEIRRNGFKRDKKTAMAPKKKNNPPEEKVENAFAALKGLF